MDVFVCRWNAGDSLGYSAKDVGRLFKIDTVVCDGRIANKQHAATWFVGAFASHRRSLCHMDGHWGYWGGTCGHSALQGALLVFACFLFVHDYHRDCRNKICIPGIIL